MTLAVFPRIQSGKTGRPQTKSDPRRFTFIKVSKAALTADVFKAIGARVGLGGSDVLELYLLHVERAQTALARDGSFGSIGIENLAAHWIFPATSPRSGPRSTNCVARASSMNAPTSASFRDPERTGSACRSVATRTLSPSRSAARAGWEKTPRWMNADRRILAAAAKAGLRRPAVLHVWRLIHDDAQYRADDKKFSVDDSYIAYVTGLSLNKVRAVLRAFDSVGLTANGRDELYIGEAESTARTREWRARNSQRAAAKSENRENAASRAGGNVVAFARADSAGSALAPSQAPSQFRRREDVNSPISPLTRS